jgi:hypothetical protein
MRYKVGWVLTLGWLLTAGVTGVHDGVRELGHELTAGIASAFIGAAVVWGARAAMRSGRAVDGARRARGIASIILLVACVPEIGACRQLYGGPPIAGEPIAGDMDRLRTKRVRAKREPNVLLADDLTECTVVPEVFTGVKPGDHWRCAWRPVPSGM